MKKLFFIIVLLFSTFIFAEEYEKYDFEIGDSLAYWELPFSTENNEILEILPSGKTCKVTFSSGNILYLKKGYIFNYKDDEKFTAKVISWDYNKFTCKITTNDSKKKNIKKEESPKKSEIDDSDDIEDSDKWWELTND